MCKKRTVVETRSFPMQRSYVSSCRRNNIKAFNIGPLNDIAIILCWIHLWFDLLPRRCLLFAAAAVELGWFNLFLFQGGLTFGFVTHVHSEASCRWEVLLSHGLPNGEGRYPRVEARIPFGRLYIVIRVVSVANSVKFSNIAHTLFLHPSIVILAN